VTALVRVKIAAALSVQPFRAENPIPQRIVAYREERAVKIIE
jgi:hypothetical protein